MIKAFAARHFPMLKDVWRLALPVLLTNLLQTSVNVVDVFMVGRLGPFEIAAIGMSQVIRMLILVSILSVTAGSMALGAQAKGGRDPERLAFVAKQSLLLAVLFGLGLGTLGWFTAKPLLTFLGSGSSPEAIRLGTGYLKIFFLGTIFMALNFTVNRLMQGAGDTRTPFILVSIINALNILFNYLFMFGPGPFPALGINGAALGTILSRFIGATAGIAILYSGRNVVTLRSWRYWPDWSMFKDILSIGIPSGLQGVARNSTQLLVIRIITSTSAGAFGAAALAIGYQIESLIFMPVLGINVAATALVGQSLGAWQTHEARLRGNIATAIGVALTLVLCVPMIIFAPYLVKLFDPSGHPIILSAGTSYLRIHGLALPIVAISMVINGALRGAGDTMPGLWGTILGRIIVAVSLAYLFAIPLGFGVVGVWWASVTGTGVQTLVLVSRWLGNKWSEVALHKTELYRQHLQHLPKSEQQRYLKEVRATLMKHDGMTEQISEHAVVYNNDNEHVEVQFGEKSYLLKQA